MENNKTITDESIDRMSGKITEAINEFIRDDTNRDLKKARLIISCLCLNLTGTLKQIEDRMDLWESLKDKISWDLI